MKHKRKLFVTLGVVAVVGLAGLGITSHAHSEYHQKFGGHETGAHSSFGKRSKGKAVVKMLSRYDENGDRAITLEEVMTARGTQFKNFDTNKDGAINLTEFERLWLDEMRERMVDRFQDHDSDGDGKINEADYSAKIALMIERLDKNEDGKVDRSDMKRLRKHHD